MIRKYRSTHYKMKISIVIFAFIVALSRLGNASLILDNLRANTGDNDYPYTDAQSSLKSSKNDNGEHKRTLLLLMPVKKINDDEKSDERVTEELSTRSRKVRCKPPMMPRKPRRTITAEDLRKSISISKSTRMEGSLENSVNRAKSLLDSLGNSRTMKREDKDAIERSVILRPRAHDSIIMVGKEPKKSNERRPKKHVCYCIEEDLEMTKAPKKPAFAAKSKYRNGAKRVKSSDLVKPEQVGDAKESPDYLSSGLLEAESASSRRLERKQMDWQGLRSKKMPKETASLTKVVSSELTLSPRLSERRTVGQPKKIDTPLIGGHKLDSSCFDSKCPFVQESQSPIKQYEPRVRSSMDEIVSSLNDFQNVQDCVHNERTNYDHYQPDIPDAINPTSYMLYPQYPSYPLYDDGSIDNSNIIADHSADEPSVEHRKPVWNQYVATAFGKNFLDINECIRLHGPDFCVVASKTFNGDGYAENHRDYQTIGSPLQEKARYTNGELPQSEATKWQYHTDDCKSEEPTNYCHSPEITGVDYADEETVQQTVTYPENQINELLPLATSQYIATNEPSFVSDPKFHTPTTSSNGFVGSEQHQMNDLDEQENYVTPTTPLRQSGVNEENYSEVTMGENKERKLPSGLLGKASKYSKSTVTILPKARADEKILDYNEDIYENKDENDRSPKGVSFLKSLVKKVMNKFATVQKNSTEDETETPEVVENLSVVQKLLALPEVRELALHDVTTALGGVSQAAEMSLLMIDAADTTVQAVLNNIVVDLLPGQPEPLRSTVILPTNFRLAVTDDIPKRGLEKYILNLFRNSGLNTEEAKSAIVQNIMFRTIQNSLSKAEINVSKKEIWDTLRETVSRLKPPEIYTTEKPSSNNQLPTVQNEKKTDTTFKNLPIIPVNERVFKDGHWTDKYMRLGDKRKYYEREMSSLAPSRNDEGLHASITETSIINVNKLASTIGSTEHALLSDTEDSIGEALTTDHSTESIVGSTNSVKSLTTETSRVIYSSEISNEENDKIPIKYYSPVDIMLAYRKNPQTPNVLAKTQEQITPAPPSAGNEKTNTLTIDELDEHLENARDQIIGISNYGSGDLVVPTQSYRENAVSDSSQLGVISSDETSSNKAIGTLKKNSKYPESVMEVTTKNSIEAARSRDNDPIDQEISSEQVGLARDKSVNYDVASDSRRGSMENSKICTCPDAERSNERWQISGSHKPVNEDNDSIGQKTSTVLSSLGLNDENQDYTTDEYVDEGIPWSTEKTEENGDIFGNTQWPIFESTMSNVAGNDKVGESSTCDDIEDNLEEGMSLEITKFSTTQEPYVAEYNHYTESPISHNPLYDILHTNDAITAVSSFEKFSEKENSLSTDEFHENSENLSDQVVGISNFGIVDRDLSAPGYKENAVNERKQPEVISDYGKNSTTRIEKFAKNSKYPDTTLEATTKSSIGAARSRDNGVNHREISNEKVGFPRDKSVNYDTASSSSIDRSNHATHDYDPTYFGKITPVNSVSNKIHDIINKDLFYIGEGVKIPLKITRMPDGTWGLSISQNICENFVKRKCPCCVPRVGDIIEEKKRSAKDSNEECNSEIIRRGKHFDYFDEVESKDFNDESKGRYARSSLGSHIVTTSTTPVVQFAKKYNLTLDLADFPHDSTKFWRKLIQSSEHIKNTENMNRARLSNNARILSIFENNDQARKYDHDDARIVDDYDNVVTSKGSNLNRGTLSFDTDNEKIIERLLYIDDMPDNELVVNALDGMINSPSVQNLDPMLDYYGIDETAEGNSRKDQRNEKDYYDLGSMVNEMAKYGYQRDNPILKRIRFIEQQQMQHGPYRYQQNIDREAQERMNVMKNVLEWLKEVILESAADNET